MHIGDALVALGGAFLAAAVLARLGAKIGLPTIPLFMLAGVVFGPHTPGIELVEDPGDLALIAALGLVFLLFYLGLEFHTDDLVAGGRRMLAAGLGYLVLNIGGGLALGFAFGWGTREALVIAGVVGISSSAIVTKLLVETGRLRNPESRLILGVIVIEDVFLALYLAILQPVLGNASGPAEVATDLAKAFGFLIVLAALARWGARAAGRLLRVFNDELLVVFFVGLAVLSAGVAEELGVSDAIGAFMIGLVLGGSTAAERVRSLVRPLRDGFAAIFFFTFGLTIDPGDIGPVLLPIAVAVALTVVLNIAAGLLAARLHGYGRQEAANIGLTVLTRGEFSLILGSLAIAAGLDGRIAPFVAGYVLVLAVIGPLAVIRSEKLVTPRKRSGSSDKMPAMIVAPAPEGSSTEPGDTRRTTSSESR
ncbi:cation:proton antiporter [Phytohabitans sp. ZYX-F-186]|uniref:Cation:proton antiporter n=1 Tax=Phytohabitans maris TaxID=3071409 RepID=A0ABU0ZLC5_9ACTN|nr:cation:proton antiporter [Phytohabitans sp. ZYX-F-186]MDQ7907386.1 cation:proton antiporter [Phytohabitans sp. ZYX-F-186]